MRIAGKLRLGAVAHYRSISHREALTFTVTKGELGLSEVDIFYTPERFGRLLHGIYEACGRGRGRVVDRLRECAVSATQMRKCSPPLRHVPRASGEDPGSIACSWISIKRILPLVLADPANPEFELLSYTTRPALHLACLAT